jgi:hypothetical protein
MVYGIMPISSLTGEGAGVEAAAAEQVAGGHDLTHREHGRFEGAGDEGVPYSIQLFSPLSNWEQIRKGEEIAVFFEQLLRPPRQRLQGFRIRVYGMRVGPASRGGAGELEANSIITFIAYR